MSSIITPKETRALIDALYTSIGEANPDTAYGVLKNTVMASEVELNKITPGSGAALLERAREATRKYADVVHERDLLARDNESINKVNELFFSLLRSLGLVTGTVEQRVAGLSKLANAGCRVPVKDESAETLRELKNELRTLARCFDNLVEDYDI